TALAPRGFRVTLLESRGRLGGRASSFTDSATGQLIDTCQHVSMGCCTNLAHFCHTLGIAHHLQTQPVLHLRPPDRRVRPFRSDPLPAPFPLARSFGTAHYLSLREKLKLGSALLALKRVDPESDPPFLDWLREHGQTPRLINRFWGLVL